MDVDGNQAPHPRHFVQTISSCGICLLDPEGRIAHWNAGAERLYGYQAGDVVGQDFAVLFSADEQTLGAPATALRLARRGGRAEQVNQRCRKDGTTFWPAVCIDAVHDDDGRFIGFADVTYAANQQHSAARALTESEERFRRLINSVTDHAIYNLDLNGDIVSWNSGAERILGYRANEIIGRNFREFFIEEDRRNHQPELALQQAIMNDRFEGETWRVRKDGDRFWAAVAIESLHADDGSATGFVNITQDVSRRRQYDERFEQVVESAPNAMVMVNGDGQIEMVNTQAERVFGYSRDELLGKPVDDLVPERFRHHHAGLRGSYLAEPRSRPMGAGRDLYAMRKDGSEFPVEIGLNPIETDQGTMVLSAIVDISDRKQKEERITAALKEKDILLAEIHHRVKNNLQVVHSLLDLQSGRIADPVAIEMLRESQNRIRSMALIHQKLYEAKDFARVDFRNFLQTMVPTLMSSYSVDPRRIVPKIRAEEVQLPINAAVPCGLVINELVSNVLKHAFPENRGGQIEIDLRRGSASEVILSVSDNGIGLPSSFSLANVSTLGMQLLSLLADQLGAEMSIRPAYPTQFSLRFRIG